MRYCELVTETKHKAKPASLSPDEIKAKAERARYDAEDKAFALELQRCQTYRDPFKALERAAEAEHNQAASLALMAAEENAAETESEQGGMVKYNSAEYWQAALTSLCQTDPFLTSPALQRWFASHGYRW